MTEELARLTEKYANAAEACRIAYAAAANAQPTNEEYWRRDDAAVLLASKLIEMLDAGWTLVPPKGKT